MPGNRALYEYFRDCPDKPKYTISGAATYFYQTNTGGPLKRDTRQNDYLDSARQYEDRVIHAVLLMQRLYRRAKKKRYIEKMKEQRRLEQEAMKKALTNDRIRMRIEPLSKVKKISQIRESIQESTQRTQND